MKSVDDIDSTALNWVKPELDDVLRRARESLEAHVEAPDSGSLQTCMEVLHQAQGTLRMVELYGAAMVVREMERLVDALRNDQVDAREAGYAVLMRGLLQLPDYLEHLQGSHRDVSVVLLPLLNELRNSRGARALHESVLFTPNLDAPLPASVAAASKPLLPGIRKRIVVKLRQQFQQSLLAWFRGQGSKQCLEQMRATMDQLTGNCHSLAGRRLWWVTAGVLDGMIDDHLEEHSAEVKQLIGRVDRAIHVFIKQGEPALTEGPVVELLRQLLYYVARATPGSTRLADISQIYGLHHLLPGTAEVEYARSAMTGHNRILLDTVSQAIKEDLLRIKDALDLYLRQPNGNPEQLSGQVELLDQVADTLGMLGLSVPRRVVGEQRRIIQNIAGGMHPADEDTLLDVAGALLYVEASLEDYIESLGIQGNSEEKEAVIEATLLRGEARQVLHTLMHESVGSLGKVKDAVIAFIESPWDHEQLRDTPPILSEISGAMSMLGEVRSGELLDGVGIFIDNELVIERRIPTAEQMDKLADALASLEYYFEAVCERHGSLEHILDVAEQAMRDLGYWPVPTRRTPQPVADASTPQPAEEVVDDLDQSASVVPDMDLHSLIGGEIDQVAIESEERSDTPPAGTEFTVIPSAEEDWVEIEEEVEEEVAKPDPLTAEAGFQSTADEIDAEIHEIFLEEVKEEIEGLQQYLGIWKQEPDDSHRLTPIRRAFHTLKGSGRLVGAQVLGEFSWKIENMLNRVLDGTIKAGQPLVELVEHALVVLPQLLAALHGDGTLRAPLSKIMDLADRFAFGETPDVEAELKPSLERVRRVVTRRVPRGQTGVGDIPQSTLVDASESVSADEDVQTTTADPDVTSVPTLPPIGPVLLEILRSEIAQHLDTVRTALDTVGDGELMVDESLLRAVHTMHGAVAMVEVPLLSEVLAPLEDYLRRLRAGNTPMPQAGREAMAEAVRVTEQVAAQFDAAVPQFPETASLVKRLCVLRDALAEPSRVHVVSEPGLQTGEEVEASMLEVDHDESAADAEQLPQAEDETPEDLLPKAPADEPEDGDSAELAADTEQLPQAEDETPEDLLPKAPVDEPEDGDSAELAADTEQLPQAEDETPEDLLPKAPVDEPEDGDSAELAADTEQLPQAEDETPEDLLPKAPVDEPEDGDSAEFAADVENGAENASEADGEGGVHTRDTDVVEFATKPVITSAPSTAVAALQNLPDDYRFPDDPQPEGVLDKPDLDTDLLEIFIEESRDILDHADTVMVHLREAPQVREYVVDLKRDLHTLKGGAGMASFEEIGSLAHAMETLLEAVDTGCVHMDVVTIESLERGFDRLHALVQRVGNHQAMALPRRAIACFEALARGEKSVVAEGAAEAPPVVAETDAAALPRQPSASLDEEELLRAPQEMIRVRAKLLDSLVNYAGEVSIYRARLEQQVSSYRYNLDEFERTIARLRNQLRKLEIETEAQIIARYQRENMQVGQASFDPLELDRFSQLQQYSRALAESVSDLVSLQSMLEDITRQSETLLLQQQRVSSELQEGLMRTRMVPFASMVPTLRRTLRQAAMEAGKHAQLHVHGGHGEMDRNLLERMKAPFEHMIRNALVHGIESSEDRIHAGKAAEGAITIDVSRDATEVLIRVHDDGAGIDCDAVRSKAVERGLLREDTELAESDLFGFILKSGFSTAPSLTQLAGRGVGMDVVANEVKQMGGTLSIDSEHGKGTTFNIRLPFTLAVTQAIMVKLGELTFALPMTSVHGVARIGREELKQRLSEKNPSFTYAGETYAIHDLAQLLGVPAGHLADDVQPPLLLARSGDLRAAVRIDSIIGSSEIVVKSVGPQVSSVPGIFGATIMGDGSVVMILDLAPLVRHGMTLKLHAGEQDGGLQAQFSAPQAEPHSRPLVMVVDDSITMRKVSGRVLERHGYEVTTAKDGVDAIEKLQERVPDVMLLDIEMPRMDGYELALLMKNDARLRHVPIIVITSRTGEKHRQRALDIGVERYMGKPYQEADLIAQIHELLGATST